jgi:RNA polymerase sigma-70 factor (ECF subfamily)
MDTHRPLASREQWCARDGGTAATDVPRKHSTSWSVEQVYHAHYRRVHCLALRLLRNEADAEDIAQEVLLQVVRRLHTFRGDSSLSTWLHRVTVNAVRLLLRQRTCSREQKIGPLTAGADGADPACHPGATPEHLALRKELRQCLDQAIAQLPADYRVVYIASDVDGLPNAEICDRLGLTLAAVKSRLHRGRTMMRTMLSRYIERLRA